MPLSNKPGKKFNLKKEQPPVGEAPKLGKWGDFSKECKILDEHC